MTARARKLLWPAVISALALALTCSLGTWQVRRLAWKEALIARVEARAHAEPQSPPAPGAWAELSPEDYDYRRVSARGRFDFTREALIFTGPPKDFGPEPGYFVITPFVLANGGVVLVDRGFIPDSKKTATANRSAPQGETTIVGLMRAPQSRNAFTPADEPENGLFFTSDPQKIAAALKLAGAAPFTIMLDAPSADAPATRETPRPIPGGPEIVNNHFSYAVIWFSLAGVVAIIFALYARSALRREATAEQE